MVFDILASIPFQEIFKEESWNSMIKFGRLPRLYRLIKIAKIIRVIKNQGFSNFSERFGISFLKIPLSLKRMLYFLSVFFLVCHLISCLWFFISTIEISKNRNWVIKYGVQDLDEFDLYICSLYWTVTTLTTVGYGDITPDNNLERGVCMCVMIGGVFFYSYTVGTITSLMSESDRRRAKFESKLHILNDIQKTFQIKNNLYKKIKAAILFDQSRLNKERDEIIESLPRKLSLQLKFIINQNLVKDNHFFDGKPIRFINVILSHLKPFKFNNREFIFYQGQYSGEMYFLTKGKLNLVKTQNKEMITIGTIEEGDYYGDVEIILSITHDFGGRAGRDTELMALGREDLFMKVLSNCEESFKDKIIDEADKRRKKFTEMMQEAVTNHNITKNIARSVNNHERHPSSAGSDSLFRNNSKTNERRIRKIRNTLSKKTISMLESTAGDYQLDAMKKKLSSVELFVGKLEERVVLYLKKQGKSDLEIFEILGCGKVTGSDVGEHSSAIDDDFKLKISRFSNQKNRGVDGSEPPEGRPVIIQTFLENNAVESFSNIQNLSKDKDLFIFSNIERQKIRTMTEMRKDEDKDIVQNISVKEFKIPEDKDENINEIILELEKRVDGDDENQSKSEVSLSFVRSNEKSK
jgi:CRP-like cAMP-binding protein